MSLREMYYYKWRVFLKGILVWALAQMLLGNATVRAQTMPISSCGPTAPEALKSAYIRYDQIGGPYSLTYRFYYVLTMECGIPYKVNPLTITDLDHSKVTAITQDWEFDSALNVTGMQDPCLALPTQPCYSVYYFHADADLYLNTNGFMASVVDCCRPPYTNLYYDNQNFFHYETPMITESSADSCAPSVGFDFAYNGIASYIRIPSFKNFQANSSPQFVSKDTILFVCKNKSFSYHLMAADADNDSIAFHFSIPRTFTLTWDPRCVGEYCTHFIQTHPPFPQVDFYEPSYSQAQPAGKDISLDSLTGLIQGVIHDTGTFVLPVSAIEYRKGKFIDSVTKEIMVRVYDCGTLPPPKASIPTPINGCRDFTINFPNNSTPLYPSRIQTTTFQWDFGDGNTSDQIYPVHRYADTGNYQIRLIVFPGLYCADTTFANVMVYPFLKASFKSDDSCAGQDIHFINTSTSSTNISFTKWLFMLNGTRLDSSYQYNANYTFYKTPKTYSVLLTVGTDKGCLTTDSGYVNIFPSPLPLASHDTIVTRDANIQLMANDGSGGSGGHYYWSPPFGLSDPFIADPILTGSTDRTYTVSMINVFGCALTDSIHVIFYKGPDIYVPNAFTPNGDGKNDVFRPFPVGIAQFDYFRVFNRAGVLMFQTKQVHKGWDGNFNGSQAAAGTYVWEAKGIDFNGKTIFKKGTTELLR